jgi:ethanolamine-phosphate phospho-lyase
MSKKSDLIEDRKKFFSSSLSLSHSRVAPLQVHRGAKEFVYDESGQEYLDTRNNVPILGHADPRVVSAVSQQMSLINTNTRYLHPSLVELARELHSILPPKLCKFFIVSSGSEANDLALRMARYHTGKKRTIAQTQAYHGTTISVMDVSESKFRAPHCVQQDWVEIVNVPDLVTGPKSSLDEYLDEIKKICQDHADDIASIIVESIVSVGGGIFQPPGYMTQAFQAVREAGGVCICDETQVGLGRVGLWWAFQQDGTEEAFPDILTLGKQLGNGFPVAAVVTTADICESFDNTGIEFFSTFGGSTVSCAAAVATLRALKQDHLVERAAETGEYLLALLEERLNRFMPEQILQIRGRGLYLAIQYASGKLAKHIHDTLYRDFHILSTLDGPESAVMIVKPPLCFARESCDRFVDTLVRILHH